MNNFILVEAKDVINFINKEMEQGNGMDDVGLKNIAIHANITFPQIKNYIQSF